MAVDDHVGDIRQHARRTVLALRQLEQLRRLVNEARRTLTAEKIEVVDQVDEKGNVRLDAADAELLQTALHAAGGVDETQAVGGHFYQERIVKRRDDGAGEGRASVQAD